MDYLNICSVEKHSRIINNYCGVVSPKAYSLWTKTSSNILFLEGLHQFAVKAARSEYVNECGSLILGSKFVPVQIKNILINDDIDYDDFYIKGDIATQDGLYKVDFETYKNRRDLENQLNKSSSGTVYVSSIQV